MNMSNWTWFRSFTLLIMGWFNLTFYPSSVERISTSLPSSPTLRSSSSPFKTTARLKSFMSFDFNNQKINHDSICFDDEWNHKALFSLKRVEELDEALIVLNRKILKTCSRNHIYISLLGSLASLADEQDYASQNWPINKTIILMKYILQIYQKFNPRFNLFKASKNIPITAMAWLLQEKIFVLRIPDDENEKLMIETYDPDTTQPHEQIFCNNLMELEIKNNPYHLILVLYNERYYKMTDFLHEPKQNERKKKQVETVFQWIADIPNIKQSKGKLLDPPLFRYLPTHHE